MTRTLPSARLGTGITSRNHSGFLRWVAAGVLALSPGLADCYSTGNGSAPPLDSFYFPVGLAVSHGGNVLYALNSDFDLQYNGGTLQSYDLRLIRRHALLTIENPFDPALPLVRPPPTLPDGRVPSCKAGELVDLRPDGTKLPLGQTCAPPMLASFYVRDTAVTGAFGTDLQLSLDAKALVPPVGLSGPAPARTHDRLFAPLRGSASILWADVAHDVVERPPSDVFDPNQREAALAAFPPFRVDCGVRVEGRCDGGHAAGTNPDSEPKNSRGLTLPGEPFGLAQSDDGSSLVVTHQNDTKATLLSTGLAFDSGSDATRISVPSVEFVVDNLRTGGIGVASIPYDPDGFAPSTRPRPAYLETSRVVAELALLRHYTDEAGGTSSSLNRPFLARERAYPLAASAGGTDSRGIVLDPTPRYACKSRVKPADAAAVPPRTAADVARDVQACARKPLRVFLTNRTPAALLVGELGSDVGAAQGEAYDPEKLTFFDSVPLTAGPSKVFLAPIVDGDGRYALRVFVVCFDASTVFVIDPDTRRLDGVIRVGAGPFALAFDPFDMNDVARRAEVPLDPREPGGEPGKRLRQYRFAYVASFTNSFVQVVDLDNSLARKDTFETVVFTLGEPTLPKGVK